MEAAVVDCRVKFICLIIGLAAACVCHSQNVKPSTRLELHIIDKIFNLKQVRNRSNYVEKQTKGKRHLQVIIREKPTKASHYYLVQVIEDNGVTYYTHFNFYVYPKTLKIKYLDTVNDKLIDVSKWKGD